MSISVSALDQTLQENQLTATLGVTGKGYSDSQGRPWTSWLLGLDKGKMTGIISPRSTPPFLPTQGQSLYPSVFLTVNDSFLFTQAGGSLGQTGVLGPGFSVACSAV